MQYFSKVQMYVLRVESSVEEKENNPNKKNGENE